MRIKRPERVDCRTKRPDRSGPHALSAKFTHVRFLFRVLLLLGISATLLTAECRALQDI